MGFTGAIIVALRDAYKAPSPIEAGWPLVWDQDDETAIQSPHGGPKITWAGLPDVPRSGKNRWHLHIAPPISGDHQTEVARLVSLGATRVDIGQGQVDWVVLADPGGNEFCVLGSSAS